MGRANPTGVMRRETWCWISGTLLSSHSGSNKQFIFITQGLLGQPTTALFLTAKGLSIGDWVHHNFVPVRLPNSWWSQFFPQTEPEEEKEVGRENRMKTTDGREGEKEKGKTFILFLIDCNLYENSDHSCLVPPEPKATRPTSTVPDKL